MKSKEFRLTRNGTSEDLDPGRLREELFLRAFPFARRAAQVRSAGVISRRSEIEREDLEQEALLSVFAAIPRFDRSRASLRTFVERIVATSIASVYRRMGSEKRTKPADYKLPGSLQLLVRVELRVDLQQLLERLEPRDRQVARLLPEYCRADIARRLKMSRAAVYRSISRIRNVLREGGFH